MFFHIFKLRIKRILGDKVAIFWTLMFPILLATFFNLAFSNLDNIGKFETTNVGLVLINENESFVDLIKQLSTDDNDNAKIFNYSILSKEEADEKLSNNEITGYYLVEGKIIKLVISSNGLKQTLMKTVLDEFYQVYSVIGNISEYDVTKLNNEIIENITSDIDNFITKKNNNVSTVVVYFYALIGMVCINTGTFGIDAINDAEANLSTLGARINISPTKKRTLISASVMAALFISYLQFLILLFYLYVILNISFGDQIYLILLIALFGNLAGIMLGTLVGAASKKSAESKYGILISISMLFSFFAGLMIADMKYIVAKNAPILSKINPVALISDALYSLYYFDTNERYFMNLLFLIIFIIVITIITILLTRRKKYASI